MPRPQGSEGTTGSHIALSPPPTPTDDEPRSVIVYLIPPSPLDLYENRTPKLTCLVVDLESEENVTVMWSQEHKKSAGLAHQKCTKHLNATTSITSILSVDAKDWIVGAGYRCTDPTLTSPSPLCVPSPRPQVSTGDGGWASPSSCSGNTVNWLTHVLPQANAQPPRYICSRHQRRRRRTNAHSPA